MVNQIPPQLMCIMQPSQPSYPLSLTPSSPPPALSLTLSSCPLLSSTTTLLPSYSPFCPCLSPSFPLFLFPSLANLPCSTLPFFSLFLPPQPPSQHAHFSTTSQLPPAVSTLCACGLVIALTAVIFPHQWRMLRWLVMYKIPQARFWLCSKKCVHRFWRQIVYMY